jgi:predicted membrane-bound spermidine synthase
MSWYFAFFLVSGFCGILYELVWMRLAMAQFGVTTALVSIVLSMFMAGLGLGSWGAGALVRKRGQQMSLPPLLLYAFAELAIGISALIVPIEFSWGHRILARMAAQSADFFGDVLPRCGCLPGIDADSMVRLHGRHDTARYVCDRSG